MRTPSSTPSTPPATSTPTTTHVILVPGFWLGAWAWDDVVPHLREAGLEPHAVTLPGLASPGTDRTGLTLEDHVRAVTDLVDTLDGDVVLVGHSGGAMVVHAVVDRRPERIDRAVYVDSGPMRDGVALRPGLPVEDLPLPSWSELEAEGSSLDGLDDDARARFRACAVPHPGGVAASPLTLTDARRLDVPVTVVCTSIPSAVLRELVSTKQMPTELAEVATVDYVDLPTGHWPMLSRPRDLAAAIAGSC